MRYKACRRPSGDLSLCSDRNVDPSHAHFNLDHNMGFHYPLYENEVLICNKDLCTRCYYFFFKYIK